MDQDGGVGRSGGSRGHGRLSPCCANETAHAKKGRIIADRRAGRNRRAGPPAVQPHRVHCAGHGRAYQRTADSGAAAHDARRLARIGLGPALSFLARCAELARLLWRWLRAPFWLGLGFVVAFIVPYTLYLDAQVRERFDDLSWETPTRIYARPLELAPGMPLDAATLKSELEAARYDEITGARAPGSFMHDGDRFVISRRAFASLDGLEKARRVEVVLSRSRVFTVKDIDSGKSLERVRLDPARIATLYGAEQEERRVAKLGQMPPLLVSGLQAVEDRNFKHHHGVDFIAILRASWANLIAGHVVQGGSTLTQQLVKNLFLDRGQNFLRKGNEALIALLIEARYDKHRILEAYVNEIFLGQQGGQAVHGFAAASEFYFGRELGTLRAPDVALLVGLVQGPSYYDPRRAPERALARRNLVLQQFFDTGLIDADELARGKAGPLGISETPGLPRNRFPAFLDLVRTQLKRDYDDAALRGAGLSVLTTLVPSTQLAAEKALRETLAALGKKQEETQAALVVTGAHDGEVQAVIGDRAPDQPGFNRALDARRPIGSLVKPFVFLAALAQPQRYSLASIVEDAPVSLPQPNGKNWMPQNADKTAHGRVALVDVLTNSWNLSTVRLGMLVGVDRVRALIASFGFGRDINPNPSLLLGALDLSPLEVAPALSVLRRRRTCAAGHRRARRARPRRQAAAPLRQQARRRRLRRGRAPGHLCDAAGQSARHRARGRRRTAGRAQFGRQDRHQRRFARQLVCGLQRRSPGRGLGRPRRQQAHRPGRCDRRAQGLDGAVRRRADAAAGPESEPGHRTGLGQSGNRPAHRAGLSRCAPAAVPGRLRAGTGAGLRDGTFARMVRWRGAVAPRGRNGISNRRKGRQR
ncbi:transglycosylase domain-containing protein [Tahibacter sp. UC22_41]|uniref:transglycosylase domain-containing protein n=1 Tax=Tahibacter sp. UC22_41 TaxID=3350178 RepID=UPI0036DE2440